VKIDVVHGSILDANAQVIMNAAMVSAWKQKLGQ